MTRRARRAGRLIGVVGALFTAGALGCKGTPAGPKRADDQAAHAARYHPDVRRTGAVESPAPEAPATQPSLFTHPGHSGPGPIGTPVLFVNGDPITVQEILEPLFEDLTRQARLLGEIGYPGYLTRKIGDQIRYQTSTLVVYQQARNAFSEKAGEILDKEVERVIKDVISRRFAGVRARYERHLQKLGLTVADVKERTRREIMVRQFLHERFRPALTEPSRRELKKYYEAHLNEFTTPAKAELFLIEVPIEAELGKPLEQAAAEEIAEARKRARGRLKRAHEELHSGVDFAAAAKRYSKGIHSSSGGAWGEISPGALTKRWAGPAEVLFTLQPGQISEVIESDETVFIVKCGRRTPRHQLSFEQAQAQIITRLKDEQYNRMSSGYVGELLAQATMDRSQQLEFFQAVLAAAPRPPHREGASQNTSTTRP